MEIKDLNIGLTLSGGGVRASSFHLGVLARLADENLLEKVTMISSVSGGSLVVGLIYQSNNNKWPTSQEFKTICMPYVQKCLTERNLQLNAIGRLFVSPLTIIKKGRAAIFSGAMKQCWGITSNLNDIPNKPRWNINATAIESGKSWRFIPNERMGDWKLNYVDKPKISLSDALCSSAAVPFLIGPYKIKTKDHKWYQYISGGTAPFIHKIKTLHIWDGGAYDNLGLEPLIEFEYGVKYRKEINFIIISDAAAAIDTNERKWYNPMRLIDITMDQVRALRARTMWDHFKTNKNTGVYVMIGESNEINYGKTKPDFPLTDITKTTLTPYDIRKAKEYPTTLWKMQTPNFSKLYLHGWEAANASLICQCPNLFTNQKISNGISN